MISDIALSYVEGIHQHQKYLATWYPSMPIDLGDRGILSGSLWVREGPVPAALLDSGIRTGSVMPTLDWSNTKEFSVETKAAGKAAPGFTGVGRAEAGVAYTFQRGGGVLFSAVGVVVHELVENFAVRQWMLDEYRAGRLAPDTLVVTKLVRVTSAVILMAEADQARVELRLNVGVGPTPHSVAGLRGEAHVASAVGMHERLVLGEGAAPLFGGLRLKRNVLRAASVGDSMLGDPSAAAGDQAGLSVFDFDDDDPFEEVGPSLTR